MSDFQYAAKKGFCDDLTEGKFSLPLIHFLQYAPRSAADRIHGLIYHRSSSAGSHLDLATKTWILSEMRKAGTLDFVHTVLSNMHSEILKTLDNVECELGENEKFRAFLNALSL